MGNDLNIDGGTKFESTTEIVGASAGESWYHGDITDNEAESRLKAAAESDGNYLVYDYRTIILYYRTSLW